LNRWIGLLFAIGSLCFAIGPFPGYVHLVGASADAATFFIGSIFFTSAALLQLVQERGWATGIQFAGTLFFNLSTGRALNASNEAELIWRPDALGSICFLVASWLAWRVGRDRIAVLNLVGSVFFGISAVAGYVVPSTGDTLDLAAANLTTVLGALCFLAGALLLLPRSRPGRPPEAVPAPSGR
jgi:hypothetical protein